MEKHLEKAKNRNYAKAAGILLIIFGIGVPIVSGILPRIIWKEYSEMEVVSPFGILIMVPLWVLPVIGGIFALKRTNFAFVLSSSITSLLYWYPFGAIFWWVINRASLWYLLYLPLSLMTLAAFILLLISRKEFH